MDSVDKWHNPCSYEYFRWIIRPKLAFDPNSVKITINLQYFQRLAEAQYLVKIVEKQNDYFVSILVQSEIEDGESFSRQILQRIHRLIRCEPIQDSLYAFVANDTLCISVSVIEKGPVHLPTSVVANDVFVEQNQHFQHRATNDVSLISFRDAFGYDNSETSHLVVVNNNNEFVGKPAKIAQTTIQDACNEDRKSTHQEAFLSETLSDKISQDERVKSAMNSSKAEDNQRTFSSEIVKDHSRNDQTSLVGEKRFSPNDYSDELVHKEPNQTIQKDEALKENIIGTLNKSDFDQKQVLRSDLDQKSNQTTTKSNRKIGGDLQKLMNRFTPADKPIINKVTKPIDKTLPKQSEPSHQSTNKSQIINSSRQDERLYSDNDRLVESVELPQSTDGEISRKPSFVTTMSTQAMSLNPEETTFSHPYEELNECEFEHKFNETEFCTALNQAVNEGEPDILRVTLDVSDFSADQLKMFLIGDEIHVNVEIVRLNGLSKTLTKKFPLPSDANVKETKTILTQQGILQIDIPVGSYQTKMVFTDF